MLKRPRLPSPSLSQEDPRVPIPNDTPGSFFHNKRRRTLGPIIDSHERETITLLDDDDDGEDSILETDGEKNALDASDALDVIIQEYEHVNGLLHKLHFQSQRFNPTSPQAGNHADCESLGKDPKSFSLLPNVLSEDTPQPGESDAPQDTRFVVDGKQREHGGFQPRPLDLKAERRSVANNYEESNRMLGSLVLSRRLHLRSCCDTRD